MSLNPNIKFAKQGFINYTVALLVTLGIIVALSGYWVFRQSYPPITPKSTAACTQEAKQCPDGSSVGRTGPNCEFAECPEQKPSASSSPGKKIFCGGIAGISCPQGYTCKLNGNYPDASGACIKEQSNTKIDTSTWKTYRNEKYGFEMKYPKDMTVEIESSSIKNEIATLKIYDPNYRPPEDAVGQQVRHEFREISMNIYPFSPERLRKMEENNFKTDELGQHVWIQENIKIRNGTIEAYIMNSGLIGPYFSALLYNNFYILDAYTAYGDSGDFAQSILSTFRFTK